MGQIDCTKLTAKSAIIPLLVLIVIDIQSGAMAGQVVAGNDMRSLPEQNSVFAQAGSTGGTLGKQGKSASGDQDTDQPRRREGASSQRRERNQPEPRAMASSRYDGTWRGTSTSGCATIQTYSLTAQVRNGIVSGGDVDGHISSSGTAIGTIIVYGVTHKWQGHFGSNQASGTWINPDGCTGRWTVSRAGN